VPLSSKAQAWTNQEGWTKDLQSVLGKQRSNPLGKHFLATETLRKSLGSEPLSTTTNACPGHDF